MRARLAFRINYMQTYLCVGSASSASLHPEPRRARYPWPAYLPCEGSLKHRNNCCSNYLQNQHLQKCVKTKDFNSV